ncbi:MAG TPA: hypothetical protein VJB59_04235 [Bdellovibrionota bacterium]|nr:hypothetical protein [Bdellovibrionota bacterium]
MRELSVFRSALINCLGLFCLAALPVDAQAVDCGELRDGEVLRLDRPGQSLEHFTVQDQDGVNSCFANTASVLLEAALPNHPKLSFLQIGLMYVDAILQSEKAAGKPTKFVVQGPNGALTSRIVEGGATCKAIEIIKERSKKGRGLCPRSRVPLEWYRGRLQELDALSSYMDGFQKIFGTQSPVSSSRALSADEFKNRFREFVVREIAPQAREKCGRAAMKPDFDETLSKEVLLNLTMRVSARNPKDTLLPFPKRELNQLIARNKGLLRDVQDWSRMISSGLLRSGHDEKLVRRAFDELTPEDWSRFQDDFEFYAKGDARRCEYRATLQILSDTPKLMARIGDKSGLCEHPALVQKASSVAKALSPSAFGSLEGYIQFVTLGAGRSYDEGILQILAGECQPGDQIAIPETLGCKRFVNEITPEDSRLMPRFTPASAEFMKKLGKRSLDSLRQGLAFGANLCTRVFDDSSFNLNGALSQELFTSECKAKKEHDFHTVSVIGIRCRKGELDFLIQNSLGPRWKPSSSGFYPEEGGRVWMDQHMILKSVYEFAFIEKN